MQYAAKSPEELTPRAKILSMSGLDFMLGVLEGRLAGAPIANTLNFRVTEVEEGRVVFSGSPGFEVLNPSGAVHGGWYGALLDSALGCAVMTGAGGVLNAADVRPGSTVAVGGVGGIGLPVVAAARKASAELALLADLSSDVAWLS